MILESIRYNLARLFTFSGREPRDVFWPYAIGVFLASMVAGALLMIPMMMGMMARIATYAHDHPEGLPRSQPGQPPVLPPELMPDVGATLVPSAILSLVSLFLYAAAVVRRLHDCDRSGWWALLPVPFKLASILTASAVVRAMTQGGGFGSPLVQLSTINSLAWWVAVAILVVMLVGEGTRGPNRFGEPLARS